MKKAKDRIKYRFSAGVAAIAVAMTLASCAGNKTFEPADENTVVIRSGEIFDEGSAAVPKSPVSPLFSSAGDENPKPTQSVVVPPAAADVPADFEKYDTLIASKTDALSVRSGAGTEYRKIGSLDKGDMVKFVSLEKGWYEIEYSGGRGYVYADYVCKSNFKTGSSDTEKVIDAGKKLIGTPYVYGAARYHYGDGRLNPAFTEKEFDCSSLMQYIFKKGANVNLDVTSRTQSLQGKNISRADVRRGDLLFFTNAGRKNKVGLERIGHVALYLGNNYILHTASDHAVIEAISPLRNEYFVCARRVCE